MHFRLLHAYTLSSHGQAKSVLCFVVSPKSSLNTGIHAQAKKETGIGNACLCGKQQQRSTCRFSNILNHSTDHISESMYVLSFWWPTNCPQHPKSQRVTFIKQQHRKFEGKHTVEYLSRRRNQLINVQPNARLLELSTQPKARE